MNNKITVGLFVVCFLLLIIVVVLCVKISNFSDISRDYSSQQVAITSSKNDKFVDENSLNKVYETINQKSEKRFVSKELREVIDEEKMNNNIVDSFKEDNPVVNEINYTFNENYSNFVVRDGSNEYDMATFLDEINAEETSKDGGFFDQDSLDEKSLKNVLKSEKIYVYVGHFSSDDAVTVINFLKSQGFEADLQIIDKKKYFVIASFDDVTKANQFKNWAVNQGFFDANIIRKE